MFSSDFSVVDYWQVVMFGCVRLRSRRGSFLTPPPASPKHSGKIEQPNGSNKPRRTYLTLLRWFFSLTGCSALRKGWDASPLALFVLLAARTTPPHKQQNRRYNKQDKHFGSISGSRARLGWAHGWQKPTGPSCFIWVIMGLLICQLHVL